MSDENPPPVLPHAPQPFSIPAALIKKWVALPEHANLVVNLARGDIDHLFFAVTKSAQATTNLQNCLILYTQNRLDEANQLMAESQKHNVESDNHMRMFMAAVMAGVQVAGT